VGLGVFVPVGEAVALGVAEGVGLGVTLAVGVAVGVRVGVRVGEGVAVGGTTVSEGEVLGASAAATTVTACCDGCAPNEGEQALSASAAKATEMSRVFERTETFPSLRGQAAGPDSEMLRRVRPGEG
jgi:hypothetical protein